MKTMISTLSTKFCIIFTDILIFRTLQFYYPVSCTPVHHTLID